MALGFTMRVCCTLLIFVGIGAGLEVSACERIGFDELGQRAWKCTSSLQLSSPEVRRSVVNEIAKLGIDAGYSCGFVGLGDPNKAALECSSDRRHLKLPHWIALQGDSWDSEVWSIGYWNASGGGGFIRYDSNASGGEVIYPTVNNFACTTLMFDEKKRSPFWCAE